MELGKDSLQANVSCNVDLKYIILKKKKQIFNNYPSLLLIIKFLKDKFLFHLLIKICKNKI